MRRFDPMQGRPGETIPASSLDPAKIAEGVRQIAHDLHQTLRKTTPSTGELIELERRIDELRVHTHGTSMASIDRWLDNSRSAIRERVLAASISTGDQYPGALRYPEYTRSR